MSAQPIKPITALVEHVARALCLQSEAKGQWPTEQHIKRVDRNWREHEEVARIAIRAVGQFLSEAKLS